MKHRNLKKYYTAFSVLLSFIFLFLGFTSFVNSYIRFGETLSELWNSLKFFFFEIFSISHNITPTVDGFSEVMGWNINLPESLDGFAEKTAAYTTLLFDEDNFEAYGRSLAEGSEWILRALIILLPFIVALVMVVIRMYGKGNNNHNEDTKPLKAFKKFCEKSYQPAKTVIKGYITFLKENSYIPVLWAVCWVFHLNLASIITGFFAYYFYFAASFRFETMYVQICRLFVDLQVVFKVIPWWSLLILVYILFIRTRENIGMARLRHFEARNCGFINELPIVSMTVGSMGKKKTTVITDMALSQEVMFRQKAFKLLQNNDMRFPYFPWIAFEKELCTCIKYRTIHNLATVKDWVRKKRVRFEKNADKRSRVYGYDFERYGLIYDDGLKKHHLFDVLETYAQLYFIYIIESSLIVSNYSIREDNRFADAGNFPMWGTDFFPEKTVTGGRHAHILDFDILRLGKKVIEDNPNAGSFEFGVVVISEVGKERGNILDHKEMKKSNDEANQKNDLFNSWLKMCRHSATVDNFPFIKVFTDEQRPESWGADARDLCDIVHIVSSSKQKLAMPFYVIEEMLTEWAFGSFISLYYDFRFRRGDNTLLVYLLKSITAWLFKRNARIYNRFGYSVSGIEKERGTQDTKPEKKKYYVMNKKIYARRFSTDCFSDYFNDMARRCEIGLEDYMEYATEKATVEELKMQNSYFINALYRQ